LKTESPPAWPKPFAKRVEDLSQSPIPQGLGDFSYCFQNREQEKPHNRLGHGVEGGVQSKINTKGKRLADRRWAFIVQEVVIYWTGFSTASTLGLRGGKEVSEYHRTISRNTLVTSAPVAHV
jgi:hypothetical protein